MVSFTPAEQKLFGGVAVITGAGAGIGAAFARRAGRLGMMVYVTDISLESATCVSKSIQEQGGSAEAMQVDVSRAEELDRLSDVIFAKHSSVRLLINNAGIETLGFVWEISAERWDKTLNVNLHGAIHGVRAFAPRMIASGEECWIANLASIGALSMMPTQTAYILTKHAVQSFSECLYLEMHLKGLPIHVSSVLPGMLKTDIFNVSAAEEEPGPAAQYRERMYHMMKNYGMNVDEGCTVMLSQIAEGKFWVSSQPDMTSASAAGRIEFLREQKNPEVAESAKHLLGD